MDDRIACLGRRARRALLALALAAGLCTAPAVAQDEPSVIAPALTLGPEVVLGALGYLGVPYRYGGSDPARGFDCSGLVRHVFWQSAAVELPRSSEEMSRSGERIDRDALQPGDLVFFNTRGRPYSHVGIYIGDGRFVHAPARRGQVRIEPMDLTYWRSRYNGARRLLAAAPPQFNWRSGEPVSWPVPPECASCEP